MKEKLISITKKGITALWIGYVLVSIVFWMLMTDKLICQEYDTFSKHIPLDEHWEIHMDDSLYNDISLDSFRFKPVHKGDTITMQRDLPKEWNLTEGALRLHIRQTAVKVYINDKLVYEYGYDRLSENKTVGSGFQFINFPNEYEGKRLKLELYVSENEAFSRFDSIRIYEWEHAYRALLTENRIPMFLGSFLVIFGLFTALLTLFALLLSRKYAQLFCVSLFSICIGLWTLCYYNVVLIYSVALYSVSLVEYMALYLAPLPIMVYMHENVKKLKSKILRGIYWVLFAIFLSFDMVVLTLHTIDKVHCAAVLKYFQILLICNLIYIMLILIINLKSSPWTNRLYLLGMLINAFCIGYDLTAYYENRYYGNTSLRLKGVSSIGLMIFIFIILFVFYVNLTEKMMRDTERNVLIKRAYTDDLTQINNRRYCSEYMASANRNQSKKYSVICFDLNNLKVTNDTYGHSKGDLLIQSAADVISKTFESHGIVGRMGGDEFIAILETSDQEEIKMLMEQFHSNIVQKNKDTDNLNLSIAYGYALGSEVEEKNIERLYQIADNRMYDKKKQQKLDQQKIYQKTQANL